VTELVLVDIRVDRVFPKGSPTVAEKVERYRGEEDAPSGKCLLRDQARPVCGIRAKASGGTAAIIAPLEYWALISPTGGGQFSMVRSRGDLA
jgi:hypothetical protein